MNTTALAQRSTRLPIPAGYDQAFWQILVEVVFPAVQDPRSVIMAVEYCRARRLDILKRPVNIVPMWDARLRKEVDTIWPSITETQITAARSHEWAGMDPPKYGDTQRERKFIGRRKDRDGQWQEASCVLTFPEWCEITVYRMVRNQRCPFAERVYWLEAYGRSGGSDLPNPTWQKRPIGMLGKVSKAAALRAAFPEEAPGPSDDEMAGGILDEASALPEPTPAPPKIATVQPLTEGNAQPEPLPRDDQTWQQWGESLIAKVRACSDGDLLDGWLEKNKLTLDAMAKDAPKMHQSLLHSINKHRLTLIADNGESS